MTPIASDKRVTIQSCAHHWFWTGIANEGLILMGLRFPRISAVHFTHFGELIGYEERDLSQSIRSRSDWFVSSGVRAEIHDEIDEWKRRIGFAESPIQVRPFSLSDHQIEVRYIPGGFLEVLENPSLYPQDLQDAVLAHVQEWEREGRFTLFWNKEYWMCAAGEVIAS